MGAKMGYPTESFSVAQWGPRGLLRTIRIEVVSLLFERTDSQKLILLNNGQLAGTQPPSADIGVTRGRCPVCLVGIE